MGFTFTTDGDDRLARRLRGMGAASSNLTAPMTAFGAHMQSIVPRSIREQRDPETGTPWPKPSTLTLSLRAGGGGSGKRNSDTGRLARSFQGTPHVTPRSVSVDSNLNYALTQQEGGTIRPRNSKYLAVPLKREAVTARGARRWWTRADAQGREPFVLRKSSGSLTIVARTRKGSKKLVAYFKLVKKVVIQPAPFAGFKDEDRQLFGDMIVAHIESGGAQ